MKSDRTYKNVDISLIETRVPEDIAIHAEEVIDQGSVSGLNRKTGNVWEAVVINRNLHFSVSARIKNDKLDDCKCNCTIYAQQGMCGHIVAMVIYLRKVLDEHSKKEKRVKVKRSRSKSVNITALLQNLTRAELEDFVLAKSRTDRNFKLLLQARFIEKMPQDQLPSFIESTFPVLTKANEKIAANRLKIFLDISDELVRHFKNLIAQEDLIEAYHLIFLLQKKSFYIKYHLKTDHARFYKQHKNLLSNYLEVFKLIEAPEYKEHIIDQLEELLSASYVSATLQQEKELWMLFYTVPERRDNLKKIVSEYFERSQVREYESYYFLKMLEFILLENETFMKEAIPHKDMQECYRIIQYLHHYRSNADCQQAMHLFYIHKNLNHPLAKLIADSITPITKYAAAMIESSVGYFIKYKDVLYLNFIKKISDNWEAEIDPIIENIKEYGKPEHLVKFYLAIKDIPNTILILRENISFELLRQFDREIAELDEEACFDLYKVLLESYLDQHFGIHAQDFTTRIFNRIKMIGFSDWVRPLKDHLKSKFNERKFLFK